MADTVYVRVQAKPNAQHSIAGVTVVTEAPDGSLHGNGPLVASADAYRARPQDCVPLMRQILFERA